MSILLKAAYRFNTISNIISMTFLAHLGNLSQIHTNLEEPQTAKTVLKKNKVRLQNLTVKVQ